MTIRSPLAVLTACSAIALTLFAAPSSASEAFAAKPLRLVVPFATGGTADLLGRLVARQIETDVGQPVIVENRPGAAGNIGISEVARADATGNTIGLVASGIMTTNSLVFSKMPFDVARDLIAVAPIAQTPSVVFVNRDFPADSLPAFVADAKGHPGKISYGSAGSGSTTHLSAALLGDLAGVEMIHVAYKGAAPFTTDLVGGQIQMVAGPPASFMPHVRNGRLKALAVASERRSPLLPDVPTSAEAGLPGFLASTWYGIVVPTGTPAAVVARLNRSVATLVNSEAGKKALDAALLEPMQMSSEAFGSAIAAERKVMTGLVARIGLPAQ